MRATTRREFLHAALVAAGTGLLPACRSTTLGPASEDLPAYHPGEALPWRNWAANQGCRPALRGAPTNEVALADLLRTAPGVIRPVGAGHSFSPLVPSDGTLVACDLMSGVVSADTERLQAEVWAGTRLHQLGPRPPGRGAGHAELARYCLPSPGWRRRDIDPWDGAGFRFAFEHAAGVDAGDARWRSHRMQPGAEPGDLSGRSLLVGRARCREPNDTAEPTILRSHRDHLARNPGRRVGRDRGKAQAASPLRVLCLSAYRGGVGHRDGGGTPGAHARSGCGGRGTPIHALRDAYRKVGGVPLLGSRLYESIVSDLGGTEPIVRSGPSFQVLTHVRISRFREMEYTVPSDAGPDCLRGNSRHDSAQGNSGDLSDRVSVRPTG